MTEELSREAIADAARRADASPAVDWGEAQLTTTPLRQQSDYVTTYRFFKQFQINILILLVIFVTVLLLFDSTFLSNKPVAKEILPLILPLFTFVLGMGTRARE